jgi:hypothetical protein
VIAVQNPLASLTGDVETTKRVIDAQTGPVVVVGHSYGRAVITEAAAGNPNVKALVYVAAFAPEVGEPIGAYGDKYPTGLGAGLRPDAAGFLYIDRAQFHDLFAADVPKAETDVAAATQKPIIGSVFGASVQQAAWKTIPSFYLVTQDDKAINPELERFYAKRMGATVTEVKSSHVPFLSHPLVVARFIEQAASAAARWRGMSDSINHDRRGFLGTAAAAIMALRFGPSSLTSETSMSFDSLKQIDASVLNPSSGAARGRLPGGCAPAKMKRNVEANAVLASACRLPVSRPCGSPEGVA